MNESPSGDRNGTNGAPQAAGDDVRAGHIGLLWPPGVPRATSLLLDPDCVRDLGLSDLAAALALDPGDRRTAEEALLRPSSDPQVIGYRQEIVADLLAHPEFAERLTGLMPKLRSLSLSRYRGRSKGTVDEVIWRLGELESFVECVDALRAAFAEAGAALRSAGLVGLREALAAIAAGEGYQSLERELPGLLAQVRAAASVTIGVNLDQNLQPVAATLLAVNDRPFRGSSWLGRLFGGPQGEWEGIAPLHTLPEGVSTGSQASGMGFTLMMVPLFRDLAYVLQKAADPVARGLKRFADVNAAQLDSIAQELPFYLGAVRLIETLRGLGLPLCRPELAPAEERVCQVTGAYNVNLALRLAGVAQGSGAPDLRAAIVPNDVDLGPAGRIVVLTGPNQGGKTTYLQAIGLIQALAQAGLYVPGESARISPVDGIYTHFPVEEKLGEGTGRFGDEARRLRDIFGRVTRQGLVLLNEALSSTSAGEGLYLGQDILRVLRLLGARAVFSTHLHELAAGVDELNASTPGDSLVVSMVASPVRAPGDAGPSGAPGEAPVEAPGRSYRVVFSPPLGRSYARETAGRYGVSYEQLAGLLKDRGLL